MKSSASGRTVSPTRLVSSRNITSTISEENSAASTFRASLSSNRVKSSAFSPKTGLPDLESITVTESRLAPEASSAHRSVRIQNLFFNANLHPGIEFGNLRDGDLLAILNTFDDLCVRPETIADFDLPRLDGIVLNQIDFVRAEYVIDGPRRYQLDGIELVGADTSLGVGARF